MTVLQSEICSGPDLINAVPVRPGAAFHVFETLAGIPEIRSSAARFSDTATLGRSGYQRNEITSRQL